VLLLLLPVPVAITAVNGRPVGDGVLRRCSNAALPACGAAGRWMDEPSAQLISILQRPAE